jgi:hypothetical protein
MAGVVRKLTKHPHQTMANKTMAKKSKKKKSKAQPLCLQSTVERMARKLLPNQYKKNNSSNSNNAAGVSLSVVEDQFRLLGTRIAVGRLLGGGNVVDTAERRAAVLLQQAYGIPWKSLAVTIGVQEKDIKKLEQLQHVIRNHLLQPPTTTTTRKTTTTAAAAAVTTRSRTRIQPPPAAETAQRTSSFAAASRRSGRGGINNNNDDDDIDDDIDDNENTTVNVGSSSTIACSYTTPQIIPSLVLRLSGHLGDKNDDDDPHGVQQRATHLLQFIYQQYQLTAPVVTSSSSSSSSCADDKQQQQRRAAHWYELRRYAAAYEVAAVMAVIVGKLSILEVAVTAAHGACTRFEVLHVWPRVQQAWTDYCATNKMGPATRTRSGGGSRSTAGTRMATAMAKRQVQKMVDSQQPATKRVKRTARGGSYGDGDQDDSDQAALLFAHSMAAKLDDNDDDNDDDRDGLADGEADCDNSNMDAWKQTVLADAIQEHSSIELAARQVLAKYDLLTTFLAPE